MICDFQTDLEMSFGARRQSDIEILEAFFKPFCKSVKPTKKQEDKKGIDYVVTLTGGAIVNIDAKTRRKLKERDFIDGDVPLALERWSVMPKDDKKGKIGWTLNTETEVDYILYTFDKTDTNKCYLLPFQLLRKAFLLNGRNWIEKYQTMRVQPNGNYNSQAMFVPASVVVKAVRDLMITEASA